MPSTENIKSGTAIPSGALRSIEFDSVKFGYDPRSPVLDDVSFAAHAGELTALAGASGSGKSTVIGLLFRFFDPDSGRILYNGIAIQEFDLPAWRSMMSVALQENPLFTATLRDNILYSRPEASDEELWTALRRAALAEFVQSLPGGLNTMLGEKGAKISAGQAQRIGLARALLRDAPILLLDEPTSALDGNSEEIVMNGIREWIADAPARRLVILVTHRKGSAARADRIYRIDRGRLAAGSIEALEYQALAGGK